MNNEIVKKEENQITASREQQVLLPIAENYLKTFPEMESQKVKQNIISMALKLSEVKDKAGRKALDVCTKESVMQVAQEVIIKGLDLTKSQGALIVRGDKLMLQAQYQGRVKLALELNPFLSHFNFVPIYKDDKVKIVYLPDGKLDVVTHDTSFMNIGNNNLVGGYVRAIKKDGTVFMTEIMTMEQIKIAWSKSSNPSQDVHKQFVTKMVRKTILNSICTWLINTTGEQDTLEDFDNDIIEHNNNNNNMTVNIEENQSYAEPVYSEPKVEEHSELVVEEEMTTEEMEEVIAEILEEEEEKPFPESLLDNEIIETNHEEEVYYSKWKEELSKTGEWEMVKDSYDSAKKTVRVRRK